jgi:hypothetical protein
MRHANVRTTAEIYGLDPDLTPAHREADSGVVKMLLGVQVVPFGTFRFYVLELSLSVCWFLGQDSTLEPFGLQAYHRNARGAGGPDIMSPSSANSRRHFLPVGN